MDVVGGVLLDDGTECKVFTGVGDHSRYCIWRMSRPAWNFG